MIEGWIISNALWLLLLLGALSSFFWLLYFRKRLSISGGVALVLAFLHTALGVLCVKIFAFLENGEGGMSLFGGVFFMPLFYFIGAKLTKRNLADVVDVFTVCMPLTLLFARMNCMVSGCCLGASVFGSADRRWPTRELEIIFYILFAVWLGYRVLKNRTHGTAYSLYMMLYGIFRFLVEFLRENAAFWGPFHLSHVWALLSLLLGAGTYAVVVRMRKKMLADRHSSRRKIRTEA